MNLLAYTLFFIIFLLFVLLGGTLMFLKQYSSEIIKLNKNYKAREEEFNKQVSNLEQNHRAYKEEVSTRIAAARQETLLKSRATLRGQATEHIAPFLTDKYNPKDYRFLGNPIDFVVYSGLSNMIDGLQDTLDEIIFLEIKTGKSKLTKSQRRIRDAIIEGKISFVVWNPETKELKEYKNESDTNS